MSAAPAEVPGGGASGDDAPLEVPPPTMTVRLASATLLLEAFIVFFATIVASRFVAVPGGPSVGAVFAVGGAMAVAFVLAGGVVRRPGGIALGTGLQVLLIALGFLVPSMFFVGALFAALWFWLVSIGRRVDRDRRAWAADLAAGGSGGTGGRASA